MGLCAYGATDAIEMYDGGCIVVRLIDRGIILVKALLHPRGKLNFAVCIIGEVGAPSAYPKREAFRFWFD